MTDRHGVVSEPLSAHEPGFREELAALGYDKRRADSHLDLLADLSGWLQDEGLASAELTEPRVTQFLGARRLRGHQDLVTPRGAALLLSYLRRLGVIPLAPIPVPEGPAAALLVGYRDYLASERGLAESGVARYVAEVAPFVGVVAGAGGIDWAAVSAADGTRFVVEACSGRGRRPSSSMLSGLRSFLRFAQLEGWISLPLAQAVPSVAG